MVRWRELSYQTEIAIHNSFCTWSWSFYTLVAEGVSLDIYIFPYRRLQRQREGNRTELKEAVKTAKKGVCFIKMTPEEITVGKEMTTLGQDSANKIILWGRCYLTLFLCFTSFPRQNIDMRLSWKTFFQESFNCSLPRDVAIASEMNNLCGREFLWT